MKKTNTEIGSTSKTHVLESQEEESNSEDEENYEEENEIQRELADVTFEELQKAKSDGSISVFRKSGAVKKCGRANKNRPMEVSSKKPVSCFREVIQAPKKVIRDPRFESLCGELDIDRFRSKYNFLFENNLPAEREELKKQLKKSKDPDIIAQLKDSISSINKQLKYESVKKADAAILAEHRKKEREAAKKGKQPFYLKESEIRKQRLVEKYNKLKTSGKLESFIEKKRKKNASKDNRFLPYRRSSNSEQNV